MKRVNLILLFIVYVSVVYSQNTKYSRNGFEYSSVGEIRFLVVFADVISDSALVDIHNWNEGELPSYADKMIDADSDGNLVSHISRFYRKHHLEIYL